MTYILILFIILIMCWLIFSQRYFLYALACTPSIFFIITANYLFASIMILLMIFFMNTDSQEPINKNHRWLKSLTLAIAISCLPVATYFSAKKIVYQESPHGIFLSVILGLLIVFIAASSAIGAGMNRTKGDNKTYE